MPQRTLASSVTITSQLTKPELLTKKDDITDEYTNYFYPGRVFLLISMLYLYIVWRDMWRCQMVSHVSSVR